MLTAITLCTANCPGGGLRRAPTSNKMLLNTVGAHKGCDPAVHAVLAKSMNFIFLLKSTIVLLIICIIGWTASLYVKKTRSDSGLFTCLHDTYDF